MGIPWSSRNGVSISGDEERGEWERSKVRKESKVEVREGQKGREGRREEAVCREPLRDRKDMKKC